MTINFKVSQLAFVIKNIWNFQLTMTNEGKTFAASLIEMFKTDHLLDDTLSIEVSSDIVLQCFNAVRVSPYGYTNSIADDMKTSLVSQITSLSNIDSYTQYQTDLAAGSNPVAVIPNEACVCLLQIAELGKQDDAQTQIQINEGLALMKA